jgi:hypothetical protein
MPPHRPDTHWPTIEAVLRATPTAAAASQIAAALPAGLPRRTLQYRLKQLVADGRIVRDGTGRWARYRLPGDGWTKTETGIALSAEALSIQRYIRQPPHLRKPVGYNRDFLDAYRPNKTFYLSQTERAHLAAVARPAIAEQPAGTYARQILNRLLIDLAWNSSRLEGNTYSLLDTRRLIELGEQAPGHRQLEAQMILNHKDAIEFLVTEARDIGFNRYTILNLHGMLANNLLPDPMAAGRLRTIPVGIEQSVFHPLEVPQLIEQYFDQILATADRIEDPFEQAFFVMVHFPYLQPFDDVNKRVSRLAANIPGIKGNLTPLSFEDVPRDLYTEAVLGVYELNRVELLRDVFLWAQERSAARYAAIRQSLGEPDPFRLRYREPLRAVVADIVRAGLGRKAAVARIAEQARAIEAPDRDRFTRVAEAEIASLHAGNFARYRIRPSEFAAWQKAWSSPTR